MGERERELTSLGWGVDKNHRKLQLSVDSDSCNLATGYERRHRSERARARGGDTTVWQRARIGASRDCRTGSAAAGRTEHVGRQRELDWMGASGSVNDY